MKTDYKRYNKTCLEDMAKFHAKLSLVDSMYIGIIGEQEVRWLDDGGVEVLTQHEPAPTK